MMSNKKFLMQKKIIFFNCFKLKYGPKILKPIFIIEKQLICNI